MYKFSYLSLSLSTRTISFSSYYKTKLLDSEIRCTRYKMANVYLRVAVTIIYDDGRETSYIYVNEW